jgi:hypothetical protein
VPGAADDPLTGPESPDQLLRAAFASVDPGTGGIARVLGDADYWERFDAIADRWRAEYFAPYQGTSSAVAAEAILHRDWLKARRN